ncbi:MAG: glycosyltransferase family 2 protein [Gammaproteobacteria bacterium]|nr:glycosyltransferase family 2 protein [Gammaproteobacteria bacterium]
MSEPLSVVVITRNVERELPACLASVAFAEERLVIDSGSTDHTRAVAERLGARVLQQDWLGYGRQKQFGVTQARHRWVLCIDADERVTAELRTCIQAVLQAPRFSAYAMPRCNRFMGRWLRHGEGYPDWSVRLFDRDRGAWSNDPVHEKVVTNESIGRLDGDLLHESENGLADYLAKQNRYTTLQAEMLYARGKRARLGKLVIGPMFRFVKFYVLRRGFLDGVPGLVHIAIGCWNSFTKYAKLRERYLTTPRSPVPANERVVDKPQTPDPR